MKIKGSFEKVEVVETRGISPIPEGIAEFAGKVVAIRFVEGKQQVVVAADDHEGVFSSPNYQDTDAVYAVPKPGYTYYRAA